MDTGMERQLSGRIDDHGFAFITVEVHSPEHDDLIAYDVKAIIDTGAAYCLLKQELIDYLQLTPFRENNNFVHPIEGLKTSKDYLVDLIVDVENNAGAACLKQLRVGILHAAEYPCDMIIGIELLKYCKFVYDAQNSIFELLLKI